jgi:hypothetical protein
MQSQQREFVPRTLRATPFDQFLEWEELPVTRKAAAHCAALRSVQLSLSR